MFSDKFRELLVPLVVGTSVTAVWVVGWAQAKIDDAAERNVYLPAPTEQVVHVMATAAEGT